MVHPSLLLCYSPPSMPFPFTLSRESSIVPFPTPCLSLKLSPLCSSDDRKGVREGVSSKEPLCRRTPFSIIKLYVLQPLRVVFPPCVSRSRNSNGWEKKKPRVYNFLKILSNLEICEIWKIQYIFFLISE